ncbi:hypothetical protein CAEBREN_24924 [Caenorhabditis brenneri]|uniref:Uncharacterized protein n=1 Tax=Caenorhabditis brenneri TaxID=135651 RepID=G0NPE6_CAEBE|nr:hypothetical protein CAEBREN_24924 [Caenorhabditis brenneri]
MSFLRSLLNCSWFPCCRKPAAPQEDLQIFPVTNSWYVSEYLTIIDQAMVLHGPNGEQKVAIFHGPEDTQYTSKDSLKVIEQSLLLWAQGYPGILPVLHAAFPLRPNTIAVSIAHENFSVAKEPHLFMTNLTEQQMSTGYHSYQWLPNGFQVTYLNLKGQKKRIPAGMCFYTCPTHPRRDSSLLDHRQIVNYDSTGSKNGYWWVVADIVENDTPAGRASKGLEQKMTEISDFLDEENLAPGPQVFKSFPIIANPYIPILQDAVDQSLISAPTDTEFLPVTLKAFFSSFKVSNFKSEATKATVSLSMAMKNFRIGAERFYTVPGDPDSNYHSCMLSDSLQACYYTEKGTCYLAGLCFYPERNSTTPYLPEHDAALIYLALAATEYYPKVRREDRPSTILLKKYGRYCNSTKMLVIVEAGKEDALGSHVKYDWVTNQFVHYYCLECRRDYFEPGEEAEPEEETHEEKIARDLLLFLGDIQIDGSKSNPNTGSKAAEEANEMLEKLKELEEALEAEPAEESEPEQKPKITQERPDEPRRNPSKPASEPLMDFDNTHKFLFKDLEQ